MPLYGAKRCKFVLMFKTVSRPTSAIHQVPDYISASIWLWGVFISHALDERLQPLLSCIDMGIIAVPLGTTPAFCPRVIPITASFYGIRIIHFNARGNAFHHFFLFHWKICSRKTSPTIRWRHLLDDSSFRRDFSLLASVKTEQVSRACKH